MRVSVYIVHMFRAKMLCSLNCIIEIKMIYDFESFILQIISELSSDDLN